MYSIIHPHQATAEQVHAIRVTNVYRGNGKPPFVALFQDGNNKSRWYVSKQANPKDEFHVTPIQWLQIHETKAA